MGVFFFFFVMCARGCKGKRTHKLARQHDTEMLKKDFGKKGKVHTNKKTIHTSIDKYKKNNVQK